MTASLDSIPQAVLEDLKVRYGEPQRFYHTWDHIEALLRGFTAVENRLNNPQAVLHAILFHDAIYDPMRSDNEAESARLLSAAALPTLSDADRQAAVRMTLATARHRIDPSVSPDEQADTALFLDLDLSILGSRPDVFDRYEEQVRAEYAMVPDEMFLAGRRQILTALAAGETLYLSDWGRENFETAARDNIARSLLKTGWRKAEH